MHTTILVTIKGPQCLVDLEVPGEVPIGDLLPPVLEICGAPLMRNALNNLAKWGLGPEGSTHPLNPNFSLVECDVMDGTILVLQTMEAWTNQHVRPVTKQPESGRPGFVWKRDGLLS